MVKVQKQGCPFLLGHIGCYSSVGCPCRRVQANQGRDEMDVSAIIFPDKQVSEKVPPSNLTHGAQGHLAPNPVYIGAVFDNSYTPSV